MAKDEGIILSPKHGVNPSVMHCFICGKETGVALLGRLKDDAEAPRDMTNPNELCDNCKALLKAKNKCIIECRDGESGDNPYRTGRFVFLKDGALPGIKHPVNYMEHSLFEQIFGKFLNTESNDSK